MCFAAVPGFLRLVVHRVQQLTAVAHALVQMCYSGDVVRKMPPRRPLTLHPHVHEEVLAAGARGDNLLKCSRAGCAHQPASSQICTPLRGAGAPGSHRPSLLYGLGPASSWAGIYGPFQSCSPQSRVGRQSWSSPLQTNTGLCVWMLCSV